MDNCLCCESPDLTELFFIDEFNGNPLIQCVACKHIQVSKPPSALKLKKYYASTYSQQRKEYAQEGYRKIMEKRANAQLNYCQAHSNEIGKRILDIGCGYGGVLSKVSHLGIDTLGLEYDTSTVDFGKKLNLPIKAISSENDIKSEIISFSPALVVMSHVLEHFLNPVEILQACRQTRVFIEVPAYQNDLPEQFANQEGHLNFFNENSLLVLLNRLGFVVEAHGSYGPEQGLFWQESWSLFRKIRQFLSRDYFFNQYENRSNNGIWIRVIARGPSCKS